MNPRKIAADIVYNVVKKNYTLNTGLEHMRDNADLTSLDIRFISELSSGVLRKLEYIDFLIGKSSDIKINKISPFVLSVLRTGAYQILFMDRIPNSAAVNESVKLIKKSSNNRLSGFVNAVLRSIDKNHNDIKLPEDKPSYLSVKYSMPLWIVKRWCESFGEEAESLISKMNEKSETIIRTNTLKITPKELKSLLISEGWVCDEYKSNLFPEVDYLIKASKIEDISKSSAYKNGYFYIQDAAASFAAHVLNPHGNSVVLDMCASPGGKTTHLAQLMNNTGKIYAFDVYDAKIQRINENAKRLGSKNITAIKADSSNFNPEFYEKADYILADVPCSGLGIIRRKPDIKYVRKEEDIKELSNLALKILNNSAKYLKKGGKMLFSTCTIEKEENEDTLFEFLKQNPDFHLKKINCEKENDGYLTLLPHRDNCDGFFISLLKKE